MKRIGIVGIALALIFIGAMLLYNVAYPSVTLRYRLTVEAEVDGHPKIGSGVREVTYTKQPGLPQYYDRMLDGQRNETVSSELRLANSLASGAFKAGR
jgi:hypothetical protein